LIGADRKWLFGTGFDPIWTYRVWQGSKSLGCPYQW
jgi:hypothetical protein